MTTVNGLNAMKYNIGYSHVNQGIFVDNGLSMMAIWFFIQYLSNLNKCKLLFRKDTEQKWQ